MKHTHSTRRRTLMAAVVLASVCALTSTFDGDTSPQRERLLSADATQALDTTPAAPVMTHGSIDSIAAAFAR